MLATNILTFIDKIDKTTLPGVRKHYDRLSNLRRLGAHAADDAPPPLPEPLVQRILSALAAQRDGGVPKVRDGTQGAEPPRRATLQRSGP